MKILIIRHGDPDYAQDSLTARGREEAELLAQRLSCLKIDDFYCSPLGRARETADAVMHRMKREYTVLPWLEEFSGKVVDPFTGERHSPWRMAPQYWTRCPELFDRERWLDSAIMQSGNVREVYEQTSRGLDELLMGYGYRREGLIFKTEKKQDKVIALFGHGGLSQTMVSLLTGIPLPVLWGSCWLPTSSVTTMVSRERVPGEAFFHCYQMGDTSHLYRVDSPDDDIQQTWRHEDEDDLWR